MDPVMQSDQSQHLEQLALAELDVANRQLADAGRTIDGLRSDVLALAGRVDAARAEAEAFRDQLQQERRAAAELRRLVGEDTAERDALRQSIAGLESHVVRLKKQLERPGRLVVKKALRRGRYAAPDAS